MRWVRILLLGLLVPLTGCNLFYYAGHNLMQEPRARLDELQVSRRMRTEAEQTWILVCSQYSGRGFTKEFADGFVEGYIDYLEHGGQSQPPTVPPPRYRRSAYLTPSGYERAKDYLIGFKYGSEVAQLSGHRHFYTVPVLLPEDAGEPPLSITTLPDAEALPVPPIASDNKEPTPGAAPLPAVPSVPMPNPPALGEGSKALPEPRPMPKDMPPGGVTIPMPVVPPVPMVPLPPEVRPSGGPIPGVDDVIQAIGQAVVPLPVLELPTRGPRGFDALYLAPTLWLVGADAHGL